MPKEKPSDKESIAQDYRLFFTLIATFLISIITSILLFWAAGVHLISMWLVNVLGMALLLGSVLVIFTRVKPSIAPPGEAFDEEYLRKTIDLQHRRWRFTILSGLLNLCVLAGILTNFLSNAQDNDGAFLGQSFSSVFAFFALIAAMTVSSGPGGFIYDYRRALNDELIRAQQAKVAQFGYILAVTEMCAVLVAATYKPQWGIPALPFVVAAAITLPGIYFLILEWRASRDA